MVSRPFFPTWAVSSLAIGLALSGCAAIPAVQPAGQTLAAADVGLDRGQSVEISDRWWTAIGDPQLDRLIDDALANNPGLAEAQARLRLAQASLDVNRAARLPQIGADIVEQRQRLSEKYIIPPPFGGTARWVGTAQANLSWSLDLAGRDAALIDQARAEVGAARLDEAAARILLSSAVAQSYVNLARAEQQLTIATEFRALREENLQLVQSRVRNQLASRFDEQAAQTLLAEARQAQVRATGDRALMIHALAALAGKGADFYAAITPPSFATANAFVVPGSIPADLLGRRPDLLAALAHVDAANAGRRVARAEFYPNIDLKALIGVQAIGLGSLFTGSAATYGGGPAIHLPIFEGGRLTANYKGATARIDIAVANYNAKVLAAVREAADALSSIQTAEADAREQRAVLSSLTETVRLDETRLRTGLGSRLDTLSSGERLLQAQQSLANIDADGALRRIQLIVALGGGFSSQSNQTASVGGAGQ